MFEKYREWAESKGRRGSTLKQHQHNFKNHIQPFYKGIDMKTVTLEEHEAFLGKLRKKRLSPASCNRVRSLLMVMYSVAIKKRFFHGAFKENPFLCVEKMNEIQKKIDFWDRHSIDKFLSTHRESPYYPFWVFLLNTGCRIGETVALHREQIDLYAGFITIDRTWSDSENRIVHQVKGKRVRHVGLNDTLLNQSFDKMGEGLIFKKPDGTQLTPNYVRSKLLIPACKKAGVKLISPHGFRHTYSAHYMMSGGNIWDLSKILGHSSVKLTEGYYAHFSREHIVKRAKVLSFDGNVIQADFGRGAV